MPWYDVWITYQPCNGPYSQRNGSADSASIILNAGGDPYHIIYIDINLAHIIGRKWKGEFFCLVERDVLQ